MIINLTEPQRKILVHVLNQVERSMEYDPGSQMFDAKHFVLECDQKEHGELRALVERVRDGQTIPMDEHALIRRLDNAENELALFREYTSKLQAELKAVNWKLETAEKRNRGRSGGFAR